MMKLLINDGVNGEFAVRPYKGENIEALNPSDNSLEGARYYIVENGAEALRLINNSYANVDPFRECVEIHISLLSQVLEHLESA
jgi:hypothetical protein